MLLLPKELQDLISEYNVEHRPIMRLVMNELLIKHQERMENDKYCSNCRRYAQEEYSKYIYWHKYNYCGEWCIMDLEYYIRRICR
jgi:hypothetical protein